MGIGKQGAIQGALEGAGAGVARVAANVAKPLYRSALGAAQGLKDKYPRMVPEGLAGRIVVGGKSAAQKAGRLMTRSRQSADEAVGRAARELPKHQSIIPNREVWRSLRPLMQDAAEAAKVGITGEADQIAARAGALPSELSLPEAHAIGRQLNTRADRAFAAERRGGQAASVQDRINQAMGEGIGGALKKRVKGLADINQRTSNLYGLKKALAKAAERPSILGDLIASGVGVGEFFRSGGDPGNAIAAGLTVKGIRSPRLRSSLGIGANELGKHPRAIANSLRAAIFALMGGTDE